MPLILASAHKKAPRFREGPELIGVGGLLSIKPLLFESLSPQL
jgi:hypothetical protein